MYDINEIRNWFFQVLSKNGLSVDSQDSAIKSINLRIEKLSMIKDTTFLDFYAVRDIYMAIEKLDKK